MSVTLIRDCPHCDAARIAMYPIGVFSPQERKSVAAFACNGCGELTCVSFYHATHDAKWVMQMVGDFDTIGVTLDLAILSEYPEKDVLSAPDGVSAAVARSFLQGLDNARRENTDAAASMFRKAIDVATRELDPSFSGKPLAKRIDLLAANGGLTRDLQAWAHLIRLDGNQGAHDDDELSSADIQQLQEFTKLFLIYTFSLPAQVNARKAEAEDD